ncbi:rRNA methyltransferase 3; mitochondrial [Camelus dromedarius]|uniref:rRNA methyltransferase 3 n=1 Tax=Camelus dromedarius TaxID=9838 RepID=A0A5N4D3M6_CAMDR|nr:rRNA methyltransferase 3; mitochondrial [Camelus dromedarius]
MTSKTTETTDTTHVSRVEHRPAPRGRRRAGDVIGRRRRAFLTQDPSRGNMAALLNRVGWATRPVLPVVQTWDLDARRWVRALRRSPVKVVFPSGQVVERKPSPGKQPRKAAAEASPREQRLKQPFQVPPSQTPSTWEESGLRYDKAFPGDKRLSSVMTIVKSRPFREKQGKILLEGRRLIADALKAGAVPKVFFFSRLDYIKELPIEKLKGVGLIKVKFEDIKDWSDLVTPQGIMGCVDPWEPKVLRAGMGAHFQVPIINNLDWEAVPNYLPTNTRVFVADNCGLYAQAQAQMSNKASDHGWICDRRLLKFHKYEEEEEDLEDGACEGWLPELEVQSYDSDWTEAPAAVVVGGETHGLSLESLQLAESTRGGRLLIPIVPGVDSLNSAMAASILLFEGKRQLRVRAEHLSRDRSYH